MNPIESRLNELRDTVSTLETVETTLESLSKPLDNTEVLLYLIC